jgi:hypothetical protein
MPPIVKDLFLSKKFLVALFTATGAVTAYFGWNVDPTTILTVATPFLIYIGAQGWADSGKEKMKIETAANMQMQLAAQQHDLAKQKMIADSTILGPAVAARNPEAGFVKLRMVLFTLGLSVFAGMALYSPVSMVAGCAHPGQTTLRVGQCILDDGVLSEVLAALQHPDYVSRIVDAGVRHARGLIDCALLALASQPEPEIGSAEAVARVAGPGPDTIARRAREVLATRRASATP